jgi:hypothetical protein
MIVSNLRTFADRGLVRYVLLTGKVRRGRHFSHRATIKNVKSFALKVQFPSRRGSDGVQPLPLENGS